jgi:Na+/proline symporter/signal transduction histidine kinase
MTFELGALFAAGVLYLALLFLTAHAAEHGWLPARLVRHPLVYTLSLGVYATSWSYYGSVGLAQSQGYLFLTIYLGVTLAFVLSPILLHPMMRLVRDFQLTSLADLLAFRYRSQWTGILVTLFMLAGALPYIALQIKAVTDSVQVITQQAPPHILALGFCLTLSVFAILFGARHISPREKHEGLVVAIAFESLVKLAALLLVGAFAVFGVFGGFGELAAWLKANPEANRALYAGIAEHEAWGSLLLLAFAAAFLLPRQFHMIFTENIDPKTLNVASWGFPLFLLLLNLPIPIILWAGNSAALDVPADYYVLGLTLISDSAWLPLLTFIGGLSAASAMMIVTSLALASMVLNHLLLPSRLNRQQEASSSLYGWLLWGRRVLIVGVILLGYGFYLLLEYHQGLAQIGLISFVAVAQFLPGIAGLLYWRRATHRGFIAGLVGGMWVWLTALIMPLLDQAGVLSNNINLQEFLGAQEQDRWAFATLWSLSVNTLLFVVVSLLRDPSREEIEAAQACCRETVAPPPGTVNVQSVAQFEERLSHTLGRDMARAEIRKALSDLSLDEAEIRAPQLRQLRERIERNLSGLIGPLLARMIVDEGLQVDSNAQTALADTLRFMEEQLETSHTRLQGLAAELDTLRRYHRTVLQELPLGVCSIAPDGQILLWNAAMSVITAIPGREATGRGLAELPDPWAGVLRSFARGEDNHLYKLQVTIGNEQRWFHLHKSAVEAPDTQSTLAAGLGGSVILIEDLTELHMLEREVTHSDRLASIGRLAAGVAHEIGNPLTCIDTLAQNLRYDHEPNEVESAVEQVIQQTRRISNIVQSLVTFSHAGSSREEDHVPVDLATCVDEAMTLVQLSRQGRAVSCLNEVSRGDRVEGDAQRLIQLFVNLLSNAIDASRPGDRVVVRSATQGDSVRIEVEDEGMGIDDTLRERIFEPFFTTKPAGKGTGLGLAVAYSIVQDHGGSIFVEAPDAGGTRFVIRLPAAEEQRAKA